MWDISLALCVLDKNVISLSLSLSLSDRWPPAGHQPRDFGYTGHIQSLSFQEKDMQSQDRTFGMQVPDQALTLEAWLSQSCL